MMDVARYSSIAKLIHGPPDNGLHAPSLVASFRRPDHDAYQSFTTAAVEMIRRTTYSDIVTRGHSGAAHLARLGHPVLTFPLMWGSLSFELIVPVAAALAVLLIIISVQLGR